MLTRDQYLAVCNTCLKRQFDKQKGIVCQLTGEHASFDQTCPDLEVDQLAVRRNERIEKHKQELSGGLDDISISGSSSSTSSSPFSSEKKMLSGGAGTGALMVIGGVVWLGVGLAANRIFFYPFFLIIGGIVVLVKAGAKKAKEIQQPDRSEILDDDRDIEVY